MSTRQSFRFCVLAALAWSARAAAAGAEEPPPHVIDHIHVDAEFIDDPFALSPDATHLAWITTDGATRSQLHVSPVGSRAGEKTFPYGSITPSDMEFLDADRVMVVDRNPETRLVRVEVFGPKGSLGKFGPATDVGLGNVTGVPAIVLWLRTGTPGKSETHTFTAWRRDNLKPLAKKVIVEDSNGRISFAGSEYKPLYFLDGFATLVGQKEGAYDKAHDIRRPDVAAKADLFTAKLIEEKEIKDLVEYARFTDLRSKHMNEGNFILFSESRDQLQLVDANDAVTQLKLPRPLAKYEPGTLLYRPAPGGNLTFSLTINPVHAEAVKEQKADKDWLDVYHVDVKSRAVTPLARLDAAKRPTTWYLSGSRLALLRKHKTMGRGGADLEVLVLGPDKTASPAPRSAASAPAPAETSSPAARHPAPAAAAGATAKGKK